MKLVSWPGRRPLAALNFDFLLLWSGFPLFPTLLCLLLQISQFLSTQNPIPTVALKIEKSLMFCISKQWPGVGNARVEEKSVLMHFGTFVERSCSYLYDIYLADLLAHVIMRRS